MTTEADPPNTAPRKVGTTVADRWTRRLATPFVPVSAFFLANYHRLGPPGSDGLTPTQVLLLLQVLSFKRSPAPPYPSVATLAKLLGLGERRVQQTIRELKGLDLLETSPGPRGCNRFHLEKLYAALEALMDADDAAKAAA